MVDFFYLVRNIAQTVLFATLCPNVLLLTGLAEQVPEFIYSDSGGISLVLGCITGRQKALLLGLKFCQFFPRFSSFGVRDSDVYKRQVQEPAFATSGPLDIYAFHCYTENSGSPSITLVSQYHVPVSYTHLDVYKRQLLHNASIK